MHSTTYDVPQIAVFGPNDDDYPSAKSYNNRLIAPASRSVIILRRRDLLPYRAKIIKKKHAIALTATLL